MHFFEGRVIEIRLDQNSAKRNQTSAWISFPPEVLPGALPQPGQYLLSWNPEDGESPLGIPLFPSEITSDSILAASPVPPGWYPGAHLMMRGPLGHGFHLPASLQHLALAAFGMDISRLLPLIRRGLAEGWALALFTDAPLPVLSTAVEVFPLHELSGALNWAGFLALDLPLAEMPALRRLLASVPSSRLPCPAQALLFTDMPCAGLAECGACAVPARRGWFLACRDGPVFDLADLKL